MARKRITLKVSVELDSFPGAFATPESARQYVALILEQSIGHYHPIVENVSAPRTGYPAGLTDAEREAEEYEIAKATERKEMTRY